MLSLAICLVHLKEKSARGEAQIYTCTVLTARIYISCGGQSTATLIIINHNFVLFYFVSQPVQFGEHFIPSREKIIRNDEVNYIIDPCLVLLPDDRFDVCVLVRCC